MNLSELAAFICTKINQSEVDDVAACKSFLTRRMQMIWNVALWKDSLVAFEQTLSPTGYTVTSTWLPTKGVLLCPTIIERVVAARLTSNRLSVQRQEFYYCNDFNSWGAQGQPAEFILLPPCAWEFDYPVSMNLNVDVEDVGFIAYLVLLDSDNISTTRYQITTTAEDNSLATTERIDSASGLDTTNGWTLKNNTDQSIIISVAPTQEQIPKRQRIRLMFRPAQEATIRVLGKRFMPTFENDLDTVPISGSENCLLAFAQADMLQRERQYGKAQALQQEAMALLDQLKDLEVVQQAHHVQITPGDGFVSEYQFNAGAYYPLTF